jgi:hypothetical protein
VDRIQTALQPVAKALFAIYERTGSFPRIRYRGFLFMLTLLRAAITKALFTVLERAGSDGTSC